MTEAEQRYPAPLYAWGVVLLLASTAILSYTDRQVLSLIVDPVRAELGISDAAMSLLLGTAFAVIYGVAGLPLGWLADRSSRRNLILAGISVWSMGTIACGLAHSFAGLFAARVLVGLGEAALSPAAISLISDLFPPSQRGRAVSVFFTGICVGIGGSFLIGGLVLHWVKAGMFAIGPLAHMPAWRLVFLVIGVPSLLWALVILLIREPLRRARSIAELPSAPADLRLLLPAIPMFVCAAMASLADNAVGAWVPSLLVRRFGADAGAAGVELGYLLIFAYGGGMLAGGWLADAAATRAGVRGKVALCGAAAVAILPTALLFNLNSVSGVLTGTGLYFALSAVVTASSLSAILDAAPNQVRGLATALSFFLNVAIGAGFGPALVTVSAQDLFGEAAGLGPALAFTAALAATIAALASAHGIRAMRSR